MTHKHSKRIEGDDFVACRHLEEEVHRLRREAASVRERLVGAEMRYKSFVADLLGASPQSVELTTTGPCKANHCVYDLRDMRWPTCVFCGSPKYGC